MWKKNETSNFEYNRETAFTLMKAGEAWPRMTDHPFQPKQSSYSQIQLQQMEISALRRLRQEEGELEAIPNSVSKSKPKLPTKLS